MTQIIQLSGSTEPPAGQDAVLVVRRQTPGKPGQAAIEIRHMRHDGTASAPVTLADDLPAAVRQAEQIAAANGVPAVHVRDEAAAPPAAKASLGVKTVTRYDINYTPPEGDKKG